MTHHYARSCAFPRLMSMSANCNVYRDAGAFTMADMPVGLRSNILHLAGISNHEFTVAFIADLRNAGYVISLDMQSFVRVIGAQREIIFSDVPEKQEIVSLLDVVKLDVVEAELLTGTRNLPTAARIIAGWGSARSAYYRANRRYLILPRSPFTRHLLTNRSQVGPHRSRRYHHQRLPYPGGRKARRRHCALPLH